MRPLSPYAVALTALLGLLAPSAVAQATEPAAVATQGVEPGTDSAATALLYAEPSFGFEIALPGDWTYDRTRFVAPGDGLGLCRGRSLSQRASLQIVQYRTPGVTPFARWMERFQADLLRVPDTRAVRSQRREVGGFPAIEIEIEVADAAMRFRSIYLCIELEPGSMLMLVHSGVLDAAAPDASAPQAPAAAPAASPTSPLDAMLSGLRIRYSVERRKALDAAMARGTQWRTKIAEAAAARRWPDAGAAYEIREKGRPAGYLTRRVGIERRSLDDPAAGGNVKQGLRVQQREWRFDEGGGAAEVRADWFASLDHRSELIEISTTPIPAVGAPAQQVVTSIEQVIREEDLLFASSRTSIDLKFPEPREPVRAGPTYLGSAWAQTLPMFLPSEAGDEVAFAVYDPPTRAQLTHVVRPLGPQPITDAGGRTGPAFSVREAYADDATAAKIVLDADGWPARIDAGATVLVRITEKEVEQRYGRLRADARARLAAIRPPLTPAPPTRPNRGGR
ncbi:MAG: hypothetical protein HRU75_14920 [Planctomycetia bacterium]|nr:MAG: hypothetical protein HRU75_14920 [Planctomycetia bacterium]